MPVLSGVDARATHLTTFTVKVGGKPLAPSFQVIAIDVRRMVNRIARATITLVDGSASGQVFAASEADVLVPGAEVEILGGYSSDESTLFKGVITRHRVEVVREGGTRLVVELSDAAFRMTVGRRSRSFTDVTDADVIEQVIEANTGVSADVSATTPTHQQVVQHQVSDWDFIVTRAEAAGLTVLCDDGVVRVSSPSAVGVAVTSAIFGDGLMSCDLELDAESQLASVEVGAWDPANQELVTATADDAATAHPGNISGAELAEAAGVTTALRHTGLRDQASLDQWAAATMERSRRAAVRGRVRVQGTAELTPGVLIELGGLGARFNGTALVSGVRHRLGYGDWTTEVLIGSDPALHVERFPVAAPAAAGSIPSVRGLQIGIVAALAGDSSGEERVQVRLPLITASDGLLWARHALLDAGSDRGTCFRPEIDDEVIVGFLDSDPRYPVILGALHSSAKPNPIAASDDNHEKAIVTRSGMRIHWNDETVVATIDTPAGNRMVLDDDAGSITLEDRSGNKVTMTNDGIALDSAKHVTIKARGDVTIEGVKVEVSASASCKMSGTAGAEVSSGANTVIRGSLVQIN